MSGTDPLRNLWPISEDAVDLLLASGSGLPCRSSLLAIDMIAREPFHILRPGVPVNPYVVGGLERHGLMERAPTGNRAIEITSHIVQFKPTELGEALLNEMWGSRHGDARPRLLRDGGFVIPLPRDSEPVDYCLFVSFRASRAENSNLMQRLAELVPEAARSSESDASLDLEVLAMEQLRALHSGMVLPLHVIHDLDLNVAVRSREPDPLFPAISPWHLECAALLPGTQPELTTTPLPEVFSVSITVTDDGLELRGRTQPQELSGTPFRVDVLVEWDDLASAFKRLRELVSDTTQTAFRARTDCHIEDHARSLTTRQRDALARLQGDDCIGVSKDQSAFTQYQIVTPDPLVRASTVTGFLELSDVNPAWVTPVEDEGDRVIYVLSDFGDRLCQRARLGEYAAE